MKNTFSVTFEVVTPESAENGDVESSGLEGENLSFADAVRYATGESTPRFAKGYIAEPNDSRIEHARWITFYNVEQGTRRYYATGEEVNRSIHFPESLTPSSRARICRYFGAR